MKFVCIPCDEPMKLVETDGPDRGSMSLVFRCDSCGHPVAMLTNAHETQLVSSLGVKVGPADMEQVSADGDGVVWTAAAEQRLGAIPSFVRPMAKSGIEQYAKDNGLSFIDEDVLDAARAHFGM